MPDSVVLSPLPALASQVAALLRARGQTVAVAESSAGGLVSAALLSIPGASAYFVGGAVVYTKAARKALLGLSDRDVVMRAETEAYATVLAGRIRETHGTSWGLGETGAAGPTGSRYGDAPGHVCVAVVGSASAVRTIETGDADRPGNMDVFARQLLSLFKETLLAADPAATAP